MEEVGFRDGGRHLAIDKVLPLFTCLNLINTTQAREIGWVWELWE